MASSDFVRERDLFRSHCFDNGLPLLFRRKHSKDRVHCSLTCARDQTAKEFPLEVTQVGEVRMLKTKRVFNSRNLFTHGRWKDHEVLPSVTGLQTVTGLHVNALRKRTNTSLDTKEVTKQSTSLVHKEERKNTMEDRSEYFDAN